MAATGINIGMVLINETGLTFCIAGQAACGLVRADAAVRRRGKVESHKPSSTGSGIKKLEVARVIVWVGMMPGPESR